MGQRRSGSPEKIYPGHVYLDIFFQFDNNLIS